MTIFSKGIVCFFISFSCLITAQNKIQKDKIISKYSRKSEIFQLKKTLEYEQKIMKDSAFALALTKGWEISKKDKNGAVSKLYSISKNGNPLYYKFQNLGAATTSRVTNLRPGGTLGLNLTGAFIEFAEWDNGSPRLTHAMLSGRATFMDTTPIEMHATHIAGTLIGSNALGANSQGIAYNATLKAFDSYDDLYESLVEATGEGRLLSNHSYASDAYSLNEDEFGKYNETSYWVDYIMELAPYYLSVWGAGNDRWDLAQDVNPTKNGYDLLSYWNTAKNGVVVGAVHQVNNYTDYNSVQMSYFSNYGPTDDGRIKPDITTKGVDVLSSIETSDTAIAAESGTSTATPVVTATLGLLQEHYFNKNNTYMKAATAKGLILHTADESGLFPGPDYRFGWGLLNAEKAASLISTNESTSLLKEFTLNQGETYTVEVTTQATASSLLASISWTDPAGTAISNTAIDATTPALVNDLDIRITKNTDIFYPWKLGGMSNRTAAAIKADNTVDPFEKIEISNPSLNQTYTVSISHKGNLVGGYQDFSLLVSGISISCPASATVQVSNVTQTTAKVSWTVPTIIPSIGYNYEIRTSGSPSSGATGLVTSGSIVTGTEEVTVSGLNPNTSYYAYIKSNCDTNSYSTWTSNYFKTCKNINGVAIFNYEDNGWSYYSLSSNPTAILFGIEKNPAGNGANTNVFEANVEIIENNCFDIGNNYFIKSSATEAIIAANSYYNITIPSSIKPNGFVNIRWMTDATHKSVVTNAATNFQSTTGATQVSPILYLKKINSKLSLPNNLRENGLGVYYAVEVLLESIDSRGFVNGNFYIQFDNVKNIEGTGGGIFIRATNLPTSDPAYTTVISNSIELAKKGSIRFNSLTNTFEGHNGIDWQPMH